MDAIVYDLDRPFIDWPARLIESPDREPSDQHRYAGEKLGLEPFTLGTANCRTPTINARHICSATWNMTRVLRGIETSFGLRPVA